MSNQRCECQETGVLKPGMATFYDADTERPYVNHAPGECRCVNELKRYRRKDGSEAWLCSCCNMSSDTLLIGGMI